jgi:hypothetical protein
MFWFWAALLLNIVFLLYAVSIVSYSFGMSIFFVLIALAALAVILWARFAHEFVLYPLHVGAMLIQIFGLYASYTNIWATIPWLDIFLHFFGGLFVALYVLALTHHQVSDFWALVLWGVAVTALVGVLWEFAEYLAHIFLENPSYVVAVSDVLGDLCADLLGALVASVPFAWLVRPPRRFYRR